MRKIIGKQWWIKVLAVALAIALNMGALDGIINGILAGLNATARVNSAQPAYADPGDGSFSQTVFDPNHDETSTLTFRFDYDHNVRIDLLKGDRLSKPWMMKPSTGGTWGSAGTLTLAVP